MNKPLDIVKRFINDELDGDIYKLKKFPFESLDINNKYRKTTDNSGHIDDSEIVRSVFYLIWKNKLPSLNHYEDIGTGKLYRGDTLNTFNTLFGKKEESFHRLRKFSDDSLFIDKVTNQFYRTYLTIGNFMLLPSKSINLIGSTRSTTLNFYRGNYYGLRDYFDQFLNQLELCLTDSEEENGIIMDLVNENSFYFKKGEIDSIEKFRDENFLNPYFDSNGNNLNLFGTEPSFIKMNRITKDSDKEEYRVFAEQYVTNATKIISFRADKIINALKEKLG